MANYWSKKAENCNEKPSNSANKDIYMFMSEQKDSFYAMNELLCFHENLRENFFGLGKKFCLKSTPKAECKMITLNQVIGAGGAKAAVTTDDGSVVMLPNLREGHLIDTAEWWSNSVNNELKAIKFLQKIDVPVLDRKKAYLMIPSKYDPEISYKLPVLVSSSFEQYIAKGWNIIDTKNYHSSCIVSKWNKDLTPLIKDLYKLNLNGIQIGPDSCNLVLTDKGDGFSELHYFGFDFAIDRRKSHIPSKVTKVETRSLEKICSDLAPLLNQIDSNFVNMRLVNAFDQETHKCTHNNDDILTQFPSLAKLTCNSILEMLGLSEHSEL